MKRQRGRNRNNKNNNHGNRQLDSNGPDVKVRGSATQIHDKYVTLARDAAVSGNRVKAENYRQHAEHYLRLMNAQEAAKQAAREEAEAARIARGEEAGDAAQAQDGKSEGGERKSRRYPPRARKNREAAPETTDTAETDKNQDAPKSDAQQSSEKEQPVEASNTDEKPTRRRKAPGRKKVEDTEVAIDAAE